jgi:hypothetical protein
MNETIGFICWLFACLSFSPLCCLFVDFIPSFPPMIIYFPSSHICLFDPISWFVSCWFLYSLQETIYLSFVFVFVFVINHDSLLVSLLTVFPRSLLFSLHNVLVSFYIY